MKEKVGMALLAFWGLLIALFIVAVVVGAVISAVPHQHCGYDQGSASVQCGGTP